MQTLCLRPDAKRANRRQRRISGKIFVWNPFPKTAFSRLLMAVREKTKRLEPSRPTLDGEPLGADQVEATHVHPEKQQQGRQGGECSQVWYPWLPSCPPPGPYRCFGPRKRGAQLEWFLCLSSPRIFPFDTP